MRRMIGFGVLALTELQLWMSFMITLTLGVLTILHDMVSNASGILRLPLKLRFSSGNWLMVNLLLGTIYIA